jgi:hypothetical protein
VGRGGGGGEFGLGVLRHVSGRIEVEIEIVVVKGLRAEGKSKEVLKVWKYRRELGVKGASKRHKGA